MSKVGCSGFAAVLPVEGVVDVAELGWLNAARESAGEISNLQEQLHIFGNFIAFASDGEDRAGFGLGEDANKAFRTRREDTGGVRVDGNTSIKRCGRV